MNWLDTARTKAQKTWKDKAGNTVYDLGHFDADRYAFDFDLCNCNDGWEQYDTSQDAWYFGVWVHIEQRLIVTYCEGDLTVVHCEDKEHLQAELDHMAEFYGDPPPAFTVIDLDQNTVTKVYDERPTTK